MYHKLWRIMWLLCWLHMKLQQCHNQRVAFSRLTMAMSNSLKWDLLWKQVLPKWSKVFGVCYAWQPRVFPTQIECLMQSVKLTAPGSNLLLGVCATELPLFAQWLCRSLVLCSLAPNHSCHPVLLIDWCRNVWHISNSDCSRTQEGFEIESFERIFTLNHWWDSTRGSLSTLLVRALELLIFWRKERSNKIEVGYRLHTSYLNTDFIHLFHIFMLFKCCLNVEIPLFLPLNLTFDEMRPVITGTIYQKFYTQFGPSELDIGILAQKEIKCEGELLQSYTPCPRFVHARCTAGILEMGLTVAKHTHSIWNSMFQWSETVICTWGVQDFIACTWVVVFLVFCSIHM